MSLLRLLRGSQTVLSTAAKSSKIYTTRCQSTSPENLYTLPDHTQWRTIFPTSPTIVRDRVSIANSETADALAKGILAGEGIVAGTNKIVIESFPGPGALSRALLQLDAGIKKLIILENYAPYLKYLYPLAEADPRVTVVPMSGFEWDTYQYIEEQGLLNDVETLPWENGVHPQLHFITHIPHTIKGEQLIAQLFRNIPERSWLFKYGRVPMSFICGQWIWERLTAPHSTSARCKVSVISEATARIRNAVRPSSLLPYDDHFHPKMVNRGKHDKNKPESRRLGHPMVCGNVVPHEKQVIPLSMLDKWDYVLRRLFVLRSTPLKKAMLSLAPGSASLLKVLTDPRLPPEEHVDLSKPIRKLTVADWSLIARAFNEWPFAPDTLMITDAFVEENHRNRRS